MDQENTGASAASVSSHPTLQERGDKAKRSLRILDKRMEAFILPKHIEKRIVEVCVHKKRYRKEIKNFAPALVDNQFAFAEILKVNKIHEFRQYIENNRDLPAYLLEGLLPEDQEIIDDHRDLPAFLSKDVSPKDQQIITNLPQKVTPDYVDSLLGVMSRNVERATHWLVWAPFKIKKVLFRDYLKDYITNRRTTLLPNFTLREDEQEVLLKVRNIPSHYYMNRVEYPYENEEERNNFRAACRKVLKGLITEIYPAEEVEDEVKKDMETADFNEILQLINDYRKELARLTASLLELEQVKAKNRRLETEAVTITRSRQRSDEEAKSLREDRERLQEELTEMELKYNVQGAELRRHKDVLSKIRTYVWTRVKKEDRSQEQKDELQPIIDSLRQLEGTTVPAEEGENRAEGETWNTGTL